ncbi:hypothetical protein HF086_005830 [Spodoptera exigua]|nr:hypothetical protein HF086_005830 [Spodoptera exigua]
MTQLNSIRQNDLSIADFGSKLEELFTDLTISQAKSNNEAFEILRPINEELAVKKFADGLRNRRLSTIIAARNYTDLKDAVRAALDEELSQPQPTTSNSILNIRDTGATLSAVSSSVLGDQLHVYEDRITINGIGGKCSSKGYVYLTLRTVDNFTFQHKFYVFEKLPCKSEGILGQDFLDQFSSITFDLEKSLLKLTVGDKKYFCRYIEYLK